MRKYISAVLVLLALLPMTSGVMADEQTDPHLMPEIHSPDTAPTPAFRPGSVPADTELLDGIRMPVHALLLSMLESGCSYESGDDRFVWNALYYALSMFGQTDDRAQLTDTALLLPSESALDFLRAIFRDRDTLPPVPQDMADLVAYRILTDTYALALGDLGLARLELSKPVSDRDGLVAVTGTLTGPDAQDPLCTARLLLEPNESMFGFAIVHAQML